MENINEWLNSPPAPEDLMEVSTGVYTQPIEVIVAKLNKLTNNSWSSKNFNHQIVVLPVLDKEGNNVIKVSGSIEVIIEYWGLNKKNSPMPTGIDYVGQMISRTITGAATFSTTEYEENEHWAATVKSLAIVNACQVLGPQFGWGLNGVKDIVTPDEKKYYPKQKRILQNVKVDADAGIMQQFAEAIEKRNAQKVNLILAMYNIDTEGTYLTWIKTEE